MPATGDLGTNPDGGRFGDNIVHFARALRRAGLKTGPAETLDAIEALRLGGIGSREDVYWVLHSVFVHRREDSTVFAEVFDTFWRSRQLIEKMLALFSGRAPARPAEKRAGAQRAADAFSQEAQPGAPREKPILDIDARFSMSGDDVLRTKDFAQMTAAELEDAKRAVRRIAFSGDERRTRRFRPAPHGERIDMRESLRASVRTGGALLLPKWRTARTRPPPLVVLADISGSMSQYSRLFLHFFHAITAHRRRVHTFLFGTRLTNITRELTRRDPDEAVDRAASAVRDWSGGTRIGEALEIFNKVWSRRVLSGGATVLLITDGLERDQTERLEEAMVRLHLSSRRLIWLNPLLRFDGFEAKAKGMRAMLPHVDEFRPAHSVASLDALCQALTENRANRGHLSPQHWLRSDPLNREMA
ncbi:vWA domain-containing protein [Aureimonas sp. D3]|uniref:vWA domain-containing protein n=1 Tax=Aureimonas sp. D3 TaxID=1638164 RepID=UPI0007835F80|nr:VWA domain-containing protein [Aureimonas sp. D3]